MNFASPHFGYVASAYVLSAAVLAGLFIWTVQRRRRINAEAARTFKDGA